MSSSSSSSPSSSPTTSTYPSRTQKIQGCYGFAQIGDDLCLIQFISSPAPQMYEVHIFRHTFVSLFSYMTTSTISRKCVLQTLDDDDEHELSDPHFTIPPCHLESDTGIVFVSQDVMARYVQLKDLLCPGIGHYTKHNVQRPPIFHYKTNTNTKPGKMFSGAFIPSPSPISTMKCHKRVLH